MWMTVKIEDNLNECDICSLYQNINSRILIGKKYKMGDNFGVIQHLIYDTATVIGDNICYVKVPNGAIMGDVLAEYKHKQLVKVYKKVVYRKLLIALENGRAGDIIKAQIYISFK